MVRYCILELTTRVAEHMTKLGKQAKMVRYSVVHLGAAGITGGTIHSLVHTLALGANILKQVDDNPHCLVDKGGGGLIVINTEVYQGTNGSPLYHYDDLLGWQSYFLPEKGNLRYGIYNFIQCNDQTHYSHTIHTLNSMKQ